MRWIRWLAVVGLFVVGFGAVYMSTVGSDATEAVTAGYLTQAAEQTSIADVAAATGTVEPAVSYTLAFGEEPRLADATTASASDSTWLVSDVLVSVGDRVVAGQELATASTADVEQELEKVTASAELARLRQREAQKALDGMRADVQRQLTDANTAVESASLSLRNAKVQRSEAAAGVPKRQARIGVIQAEDQLRAAKRTRADLRAQLKGDFPDQTIALGEARQEVTDLEQQVTELREQIDLARIVAPIDGVVSSVDIQPGLLAPASAALALDSATLVVVADVVESDVSSMALGQTATVSIDALDLEEPGTVTSVAASTEGGTSSVVTFPVTVTLTDPDDSVKPGMSADVEITVAEAVDAVAVPATAVDGAPGAYFVLVPDGAGGTTVREVTVGLVTETLAEIQSGLAAGEPVVVGTDNERVVSADEGFSGPGAFGGGGLGGLAGGDFRGPRRQEGD